MVLCTLLFGCKDKPGPGPEPEPTPTPWEESFNGQLVLALSGAYDTWETDNTLAATVKWEGLNVHVSEYARAAIVLTLKMVDEPETWMDDDVVYPSATFALTSGEPFLPQVVPFPAFVQLLRNLKTDMTANGAIPLSMQIPGYDGTLTTKGLCVMLCRAMSSYAKTGAFPDKIDTWESSFTHATANCDISSPVVKSARDAAWAKAGVTESSTVRQKATAIFNYARDEWEWENYYNTSKGAVGTINARGGNCCDLSHAVVAMSRLSGIPARYFHGQCQFSSGVIGHVVSQMFVDGEWLMADASNNSNSLGTVVFTGYTGLHYYEELPF